MSTKRTASRSSRSVVPARVGSHQSEAEVDAMMPEQQAVLDAATTKKSGKEKVPAAHATPKKLFSFAKVEKTAKRRRNGKTASKAEFFLQEARYQKGDLKDEPTGNIYANAKPRYGHNERFKEKVSKVTLKEVVRWNDSLKLYRVKLYNKLQAKRFLEAMKMVSAQDEDDLKDTVVDGSIFVKPCDINIVPMTVDNDEMLAIGGVTYAWGDELKKRGYTYRTNVNDIATANVWLKKIDDMDDWRTEAHEMAELFQDMGFPTFIFEGVADDDDEDEQ